MPAISFKPEMALRLLAGDKVTTIRSKNRFMPGDIAYCWCNQRVLKGIGSHIRCPIGITRICSVNPVTITRRTVGIYEAAQNGKTSAIPITISSREGLHRFATRDGFDSFSQLLEYFNISSGAPDGYSGYLIELEPFHRVIEHGQPVITCRDEFRDAKNAASNLYFQDSARMSLKFRRSKKEKLLAAQQKLFADDDAKPDEYSSVAYQSAKVAIEYYLSIV